MAASTSPRRIWTVGHSVRPLDEFLGLLAGSEIHQIADVRSFPGSRKFPQYGREALEEQLKTHGIEYRWLPALGGRRKPRADSPNTAWRNASFRGYADYMSSPEFAAALEELVGISGNARTAIMCSEAVWWRCHRSMIADALRARGIEVVHVLDAKHTVAHPMTAPARIAAGVLTYAVTEAEVDSAPD
jgi:uncharacterized protein (DUF488 family)